MQAVGGIIVAILVVAGEIFLLGGGSAPKPAQEQITVVQGKQLKREPFNFIPFTPATDAASVEVRAAAPVQRVAPAPRQEPIQEPAVVQPVPPVVPTETPASVCLGKSAGSLCSFSEKSGTCLTIAWSPLTCVPH